MTSGPGMISVLLGAAPALPQLLNVDLYGLEIRTAMRFWVPGLAAHRRVPGSMPFRLGCLSRSVW